MAYFKDADEVYAYIGKLFEQLAEDDELSPKFQKANTIVQYQYRKPESQITVKLREGEDGQVDCGATDMEPEVVMSMEADTAHRFWLGKVNVTVALARGQIKAKGPVAKILKLVPLTKPVFPRYKAQLEADGHELSSETDTEVAAHLLEAALVDGTDLTTAMQAVCRRLEGAFTLVAVDAEDPSRVVAARRNSPLVVGLGQGENFLGSDVAAYWGDEGNSDGPALRNATRATLARAVVVHAGRDATNLEGEIRRAMADVDQDITVIRVMPLVEQVRANFRLDRLMSRLLTAYGALALALASLGV